ncbi:FAD-binding oxidoreductase [Leisingera sp. M527]|uniref:NAD(P)/FAD-dependent oxidoreductase n=1 Tax=unclassified Leisingera TaxID=2614906 RepID=UPI0021A535F9|nr:MULTISPECIES: FAD-binding oxidoreductase [unclassified Leisingera]UWQ27724.1 FAD-binding oxidoreductase [Leisingera sp. M523]UWQ33830.1 FAD-binding oxidoreductase [Leisingera sp. M527]
MQDFIVIGGGMAGTSAAARLADLGSVTLLEMEDALGYHSSGRSAALFEENYGHGPTIDLNRASAAYLRDGGYLSPRGLMLVGTKEDAEGFARDVDELQMATLELDEARAMIPILNPDTVGFAAVSGAAEDIDTDRMLQDFAKTLRAAGGQIVTKAPVTAITRSASGWGVTAGGQTYQARKLVNAAGAWADQVAALAGVKTIGLQPKRRSMARLPAPGGHDVSGWPMMIGVGETWYAKPDAGKLLVSPADTDPVDPHDAYADDMVLAEGLARYEEMVTEPVTRVESNFAGLRSFVADGTLVLGPDPEQPDFIWCAAQGGYGIMTAPSASQLIADLTAGRTPALDASAVAALSPARLR